MHRRQDIAIDMQWLYHGNGISGKGIQIERDIIMLLKYYLQIMIMHVDSTILLQVVSFVEYMKSDRHITIIVVF